MVEKGKGFQIFANVLLALLSICAVAPFILLIMSSFTDEQVLISNGYSFFPAKFSMLLTTLYAYPLSRRDLPGRNGFAFYLFFTMLFSGGLVPSYMMWTQTFHIRNTLWALLIPGLMMGAFNVIMMRTYFTQNIPDAVIEAARIDGANEFRILYGIVLPMALPIIATIGMLVGLAYWNDWMNGLYYINDDNLYSIQVLLQKIQRNLDQLRQQAQGGGNMNAAELPSTAVRMALTVMGVLPIMVIYPFVQKWFVQGIAIGAVKG